MGLTLEAVEPVDYGVMGAAGLAALLALAALLYTLPWRRGARAAEPKAALGSFNVLWRGRAALSVLAALWALSPLLRASSLWGAHSLVFGAGVTAWTGAGWMCRIYLTLGLGVLQPLCGFLALLMLTAALSRRHRPEAMRHPNARLVGLAALCTLPVAVVQAAVAWLGLAVRYQGRPLEESPSSLLGRFFATYWMGTPQQCGAAGGSDDGSSPGSSAGGAADAAASGGCTLCTFPAAAVIAHALFTAALLAALGVTCSRLAAAVLNTRLRRRLRLFQAAFSLLALLGVAALGVSVVDGPFTWLSQACWAAYVGTVALTVALVEWEVVVWPVRDLRAVDRRLAKWADAHAAAFAQAASNEAALDSQSSGGSSALIKAHNRSADAEAYVHAAAAARTLSAVQQQRPAAAPQRAALTLPAVPALSRAPTAPASMPPLSPYRQASPHRPPLPSPHWPPLPSPHRPPLPQPSPPRSRQPLLQAQREQPSAPPLPPSQLFP